MRSFYTKEREERQEESSELNDKFFDCPRAHKFAIKLRKISKRHIVGVSMNNLLPWSDVCWNESGLDDRQADEMMHRKAYSALYFHLFFCLTTINCDRMKFSTSSLLSHWKQQTNKGTEHAQKDLISWCYDRNVWGNVLVKPIPFEWSSRATWQFIISNTDANI